MPELKHIAILGLGWLGLPLAKALHQQGYKVQGSVSSLDKFHEHSNLPFGVTRIRVKEHEIEGDWEAFLFNMQVLVINIPPLREEKVEYRYPALMDQITKHTPPGLKIIFASTTGVYANEGKRVNESIRPNPSKPSGKAVLYAENKLREHFGKNLSILRLAGLIGEDRHPGRFLASKRALRNAEAPVNLVHQQDCISVIQKVLQRNCWGEKINVCASKHPVRKEFYQKASAVLGLDPPHFKSSDKADFKIVDNTYSRKLLGHEYLYDDPEDIFTKKHPGKISIVGAGPGDVDLLTLKAFQTIVEADVILHDNLVSPQILALNPNAELSYVGRKYGDQSDQKDRQRIINELLHDHYKQGKRVARLKSGDPYIYGRAAEEARFLKERNVPFQVVPGISAALAAANLNNIPVTERNHSNALMICTAHTADYSFEQLNGVAALLKAGNTLAIYMGLKSLDKLIPRLIEVCEDDTIPINAISNVSRENEQLLSSTLGAIRNDVLEAQLPMPVVFLVGARSIDK